MKKNQHKNGLSLIEMMVAVAAAAIVILTVAVILIAAFQSWRINNAYAELRRNASLAIYLMSRDIRESDMTNVTTATTGKLTLSAHPPARYNTVTYTNTAGALISTAFGTVIPSGVNYFSAQGSNSADGVYITLGLANNNTGIRIAITNKVFVNTRN